MSAEAIKTKQIDLLWETGKKIKHLEEQARPPYSSSASLHMPLKVTLIFLIRALCYPDRPIPTGLGQ